MSQEISAATKYIRSLKDPLKRRYAQEHHDWIKGGKVGNSVGRGSLSASIAETVRLNVETLI